MSKQQVYLLVGCCNDELTHSKKVCSLNTVSFFSLVAPFKAASDGKQIMIFSGTSKIKKLFLCLVVPSEELP